MNDGNRVPESFPTSPAADAVAATLAYHERTKHRPQQYARALGYLDWSTQPDPFRTFAGAPRTDLPLGADHLATPFTDLYRPGGVAAQSLRIESVAVLLELSLGLSAWKQYHQSRWALRCNPSSGNLHPTEGYVIVPDLPGLSAGVHHYVSRDHCLEQRCALDPAPMVPRGTFLFGLSSIHWREAWKYGERAYRYCQHDVGHAIAAVRYAAAALGWSMMLLDHFSDTAVASFLGLDHAPSFANLKPADGEHPDAVLLVSTKPAEILLPVEVPLSLLSPRDWKGQANPLSPDHAAWPFIEHVATAAWKPPTSPLRPVVDALPALRNSTGNLTAAQLIRQRRSCLALDGKSSISSETAYTMLDHLLPRPGVPPWDALPWDPHIHLVMFVHRVRGLTPGLYAFERSPILHTRLQAGMHASFVWTRIPACPEHLRLFLLTEGDFRSVAQQVSCHQEIAADGAFSLGMLADFGGSIRQRGAWWYRRLFWEAGVLGQVLYLEAEAAGIRGTGIGCYFDDDFHNLLALRGDDFQDLYHFTIGGPVDDPRLTTLPPYEHLERS